MAPRLPHLQYANYVRETADQIGLSSSIQGTTRATRMIGKNRIVFASACIPGPHIGRSFHRQAKYNVNRAAGRPEDTAEQNYWKRQ